MLKVDDLHVVYDESVCALRGVSLSVPNGAVVAVLGANGAGKSTLMRALSGTLGMHRGRITSGTITLGGEPLSRSAPAVVRAGLVQVPEGRRIFGHLTVEENLRVGGFSVKDRATKSASLSRVLELFPVLGDRARQHAGLLSGGEQQMLAIARALMCEPKLLVLDEPSLGLAPLIVRRIGDVVAEINAIGTTVLLVEQNAGMAMRVASRVVVMELGKVRLDVDADQISGHDELLHHYLGTAAPAAAAEATISTPRRPVQP